MSTKLFNSLIEFIQTAYGTTENIPLHAPCFKGKESVYLLDTIRSTFVSSVGAFVDQFEEELKKYTGAPAAIVTMNGTAALHLALILAHVQPKDYILTQALSFVATGNAIKYCQATPIFIDVDRESLGLSARKLSLWLEEHAFLDDEGLCRYKLDSRPIRACVPMHTFGHPVDLEALCALCANWNLALIEDAAEALGSFYQGKHVGSFGLLGILSFNGNKIITTGGGGMILTNQNLGKKAKHLTTTAKLPHPYEFYHDELGYNYRLPNLNAALGCAQLEQLESFIESKRQLAKDYEQLLANSSLEFVKEPPQCRSNYWLNAVVCADRQERDALLQATHAAGILTRPIWQSLNHLPMYQDVPCGPLTTTQWLTERVVNLPSSVIDKEFYA